MLCIFQYAGLCRTDNELKIKTVSSIFTNEQINQSNPEAIMSFLFASFWEVEGLGWGVWGFVPLFGRRGKEEKLMGEGNRPGHYRFRKHP